MGKIVDIKKKLKQNNEYRDHIDTVLDDLQKMGEDLLSMALDLALADRWREWKDTMPIGASFGFHDEMLYHTGDEQVDGIMNLRDHVYELIEILQKIYPD